MFVPVPKVVRRRSLGTLIFVLVALLPACGTGGNTAGPTSNASSTSALATLPLHSLPKFLDVVFRTSVSAAEISTFVTKTFESCDSQGCNYNYPTAGALFDYPNTRVSLFIETDATVSDVGRLITQLELSPIISSVSPANCSFGECH